MNATVTEDKKEWFLAAGTKKVGPMSLRRVQERIASGKVPVKTKAWKEGMENWLLVSEIQELTGAATIQTPPPRGAERKLGGGADARVSEEPPTPTLPPLRRGRGLVGAVAAPFVQRYRIDKAETWRAFSIGFEAPRLQLMLLVFGALLGIMVAVAGAAYLSPIVGLLVGLVAGPAWLLVCGVGMGALSYQTRRKLEDLSVPGPFEAIDFAKKHALALAGAPLLMTALVFVPPVLLVLKSLVSHIPSIGPSLAGLSFGVDLAISATALFVGVAALLGGAFFPVIVAFEETGPVATIRSLLTVVKTSIVRIFLWQARPNFAIGLMGAFLFGVAILVAAVPAAANYPIIGSISFGKHFQMPQVELSFGLLAVGMWTVALMTLVVAALVSTKNALTGLVYLACRPGNDELMTRDDYLARRQETSHEQN